MVFPSDVVDGLDLYRRIPQRLVGVTARLVRLDVRPRPGSRLRHDRSGFRIERVDDRLLGSKDDLERDGSALGLVECIRDYHRDGLAVEAHPVVL